MKPELETNMEEEAARRVAAGFESIDEIKAALPEHFAGSDAAEGVDEVELAALAARVTDEAASAHLLAQATWPLETDCDRLDRAFAALEARRIVARQNFTCCRTCGHAEIGDEMAATSRGYTFFHMQDTDDAVDGSGLYLAFGATTAEPEAEVAIGREVTAALRAEGLAVEWEETNRARIFVTIDWKRRRELSGVASPRPPSDR